MNYFDKVNEDIKHAMLNKEPKDRLEALRSIKAAFLVAKTEKAGVVLTEELELKILKKLVKQRLESADIYKTQNRLDLYEKEMAELKEIEAYLPPALSTEEIENVVKAAIAQISATSPSDMGKVMSVVSKELAGKADGKVLSDMVRRLLA